MTTPRFDRAPCLILVVLLALSLRAHAQLDPAIEAEGGLANGKAMAPSSST